MVAYANILAVVCSLFRQSALAVPAAGAPTTRLAPEGKQDGKRVRCPRRNAQALAQHGRGRAVYQPYPLWRYGGFHAAVAKVRAVPQPVLHLPSGIPTGGGGSDERNAAGRPPVT